ncbi:MAG: DUF91 domain-containing protein [Gammaproteobacteria bacterium]|nr:DUF91 domain-containing protein [Gammaproteobacteria bacterium]
MRKEQYEQWLDQQRYQPGTITAQLHRAGRVEEYFGDLDTHYETDRLESVIAALQYSANDKQVGRPNPTNIPINGDLYSNLASYRDAVRRYRLFRNDPLMAPADVIDEPTPIARAVVPDEEVTQRIGLERDMQAALRSRIDQLESGLTIIDDGAERSVESGFIDITARDQSGVTVVIELKTGVAGPRAVAQILSYMGDIIAEQDGAGVRGILVASDFDSRAKAAARVVPNLALRKYSVRFLFSDGAEYCKPLTRRSKRTNLPCHTFCKRRKSCATTNSPLNSGVGRQRE